MTVDTLPTPARDLPVGRAAWIKVGRSMKRLGVVMSVTEATNDTVAVKFATRTGITARTLGATKRLYLEAVPRR